MFKWIMFSVTHVPGSQEILNWMAIGVSTVHSGKWDDKRKLQSLCHVARNKQSGP